MTWHTLWDRTLVCDPGLSHTDWMCSLLNWQVWLRESKRVLHSGDKFVKNDLFVCSVVAWVRGRCSPPPSLITLCGRWETWPWDHKSRRASSDPHQAAANEKPASAPLLGDTLKLTLLSWRKVSQPWGCESNRADLYALWWLGLEKDALPHSAPCYLWQAWELAQGSGEWEN